MASKPSRSPGAWMPAPYPSIVSTDGSYEISDDTDGDFGGEGWPSPPRACLAEARALARGTAGTAHAEVTS